MVLSNTVGARQEDCPVPETAEVSAPDGRRRGLGDDPPSMQRWRVQQCILGRGCFRNAGGNRPPVAARVSPSSPVTLRAGQAQTFTARAIDAEGNLHAAGWLVSQWYTPANVGFSSTSSSTQQFTHVFNAPGNYRVSVIYYDRRWEASIVGWDVTVVENPEVGSSDDIIVIPLPELNRSRSRLLP